MTSSEGEAADAENPRSDDLFGDPGWVYDSGHPAFYCAQSAAATADRIYTLRINDADSALTCTILVGQTSGSTTGANVSFSAGDRLDIATPAAINGVRANFAVAVGP
jgi:hypothetical protein